MILLHRDEALTRGHWKNIIEHFDAIFRDFCVCQTAAFRQICEFLFKKSLPNQINGRGRLFSSIDEHIKAILNTLVKEYQHSNVRICSILAFCQTMLLKFYVTIFT